MQFFEACRIILLPASGCEQLDISTSAKLSPRLVITFPLLLQQLSYSETGGIFEELTQPDRDKILSLFSDCLRKSLAESIGNGVLLSNFTCFPMSFLMLCHLDTNPSQY